MNAGETKGNQSVLPQNVIALRVHFGSHLPCVKREVDCLTLTVGPAYEMTFASWNDGQ